MSGFGVGAYWVLIAAGVLIVSYIVYALIVPTTVLGSLEGTLLDNGAPLAGATVTRSWGLDTYETTEVQTAVTDAAGRFSFPSVHVRNPLLHLPAEPQVVFALFASIEGQPVEMVWRQLRSYPKNGGDTTLRRMIHSGDAFGFDANQETSFVGIPNLQCDLAQEPKNSEYFFKSRCVLANPPVAASSTQ